MKIKENLSALCAAANEKFFSQFGFYPRETSFHKIVEYMHVPKDSSSLAVTRILFGLAMLFDIPDERGGATMDSRWGYANICHFPLLPFVRALPMPYMALVYAGLWFGAMGIMLGYKYRISACMFSICYWYLFLIEKSFWNNHSYLFGLVAVLLTCTDANCYWSIDAHKDPSIMKTRVPYWNYFILKYQFFILYFMAGMKKGTAEWLTGYSVQNLSEHWVFAPFKLFMTVEQTDYLIVHWFVFAFDLTVAVWMMYSKTRHVAMLFCAMFHLMNSRLFRIGMFPWVCLATMPLFYPFNWPKVLIECYQFYHEKVKNTICKILNNAAISETCDCYLAAEERFDDQQNPDEDIDVNAKNNKLFENTVEDDDVFDEELEDNIENTKEVISSEDDTKKKHEYSKNKKYMTIYLIIFYVVTQAFLPYSHFITKGYNNWTNGLYGYSWDMMVHSWNTHAAIVKVVDNENQGDFYIDPYIYTPNDRWTRHGDMVYQLAQCLKDNLMKAKATGNIDISGNISIYVDIWCSMNGRFTQRMYNSKADILRVDWSPFQSVSYLMPLLDEALSWRSKLVALREHVYSWNNHSDVVFLADFPGYEQEKYISTDLNNVTLTVLDGEVAYVPHPTTLQNKHSHKLVNGENIDVEIENYHRVINIANKPAYYMYTFLNITEENSPKAPAPMPKLPIATELYNRFAKALVLFNLLINNVAQFIYICISKC